MSPLSPLSLRYDQPIESLLETIGGTPLIRLSRLPPKESPTIYLKAEQLQPGGSVKDRIAAGMVADAEAAGMLGPGGTLIEPTSGNTGVGLALVAAIRGYRCILTMPADMSLERQALLEAYGAELVLTDPAAQMSGAIEAAEDLLAKTPGAFMPRQFENPSNPRAHAESTGPEILEALESEAKAEASAPRLDALVLGVGTGGTLSGVAPLLRKAFPRLQVVAVEPARSAVLSGEPAGLHRVQGIGAGFVPKVLDRSQIDQLETVEDEEAWAMRARLAQEEGLLLGISSGANLVAALKVARTLPPEAVVVTLGCDTGERYYSMERFFEGGDHSEEIGAGAAVAGAGE